MLKRGRKRCSQGGTGKASIKHEVDSSLFSDSKGCGSLCCLRLCSFGVLEEKLSEGSNIEFGTRRDLSHDVVVVCTVLEGRLTQKMAAAVLGEQVGNVPLQTANARDDGEEASILQSHVVHRRLT